MFNTFRISLLAGLAAGALSGAAQANEFAGPLRSLAEEQFAAWTQAPEVVEALRAQNAAHAGLSQADIDAMDQAWRSEVGAGNQPTISDLMGRPGSAWLRMQKDQLAGLITEVFVTDNRGLNAMQSDVTSDYWQGDEAKWQETFGKPADTVHLGEVELDESTQTYQSQVSLPVVDPDTGEPLGAVTFGVNLELLQ